MADPVWLKIADAETDRFFRRYNPRSDREDLRQVSRLAAWQAWNSWRPGGMLRRNWVGTHAWNAIFKCLDTPGYGNEIPRWRYRNGERRKRVIFFDQRTEPDQFVRDFADRDEVAFALAALTEREMRIVALKDLAELTLREVGVLEGVSDSRISQIRAVALGKMRERLLS